MTVHLIYVWLKLLVFLRIQGEGACDECLMVIVCLCELGVNTYLADARMKFLMNLFPWQMHA